MMKAPLGQQRVLVQVQALDSQLARLAHQRATMPELRQIDQAGAERTKYDRARIDCDTQAGDLRRVAKRLELDMEQLHQRQQVQQQRLDSGQGSLKELQALTSELRQMAARRAKLEDQQLQVEQKQEHLAQVADRIRAKLAQLDEQLQRLRAHVGTQADAVVRKEDQLRRKRQELTADMDPQLLQAYAQARDEAGVGVVALFGHRVEGYPLDIAPAQWGQIDAAAPDEVLFDPDYGIIMVRMPDEDAAS